MSDLKPAEGNIWYIMATLAGEPSSKEDYESISKNATYWNSLMYTLFKGRVNSQEALDKIKSDVSAEAISLLEERGYKLPNIDSDFDGINFQRTKFNAPIFFTGFIFPYPAQIFDSVFVEDVNFTDSLFLFVADFRGVKFRKDVQFGATKFQSNALFKTSEFHGYAHFTAAKFCGQPDFSNAKFFKNASFGIVKFNDFSNFNNVDFYGPCSFNHSAFNREVNFFEVKFYENSSFQKVENVTLASFSGAQFMHHPPVFSDGEQLELMEWNGNVWPNKPPVPSSAKTHIDAYERLGLAMGKIEKIQYKQNFKRLEMRARRVGERNPFARITYYIYEILGDYGFGYARALSWWGANILIGTALLFPYKNVSITAPTFESIFLAIELWSKAFITSFANAHSFLGLHRGPFKSLYAELSNMKHLIPFNAVWGMQAILGVLFTFFMALTLRNLFRSS